MPKRTATNTKIPLPNLLSNIRAWPASPQGRKTRGWISLIIALFLFVATVSFLLTDGEEGRNAMGILGWLSAFFITNKLFGVASLWLIVLLAIHGYTLLRRVHLRWWHLLGISIFWIVWISTTIGYIRIVFNADPRIEHYAGIGATIAEVLNRYINWGTPVLLVLAAVVFLVMVHHVKIGLPLKKTTDDATDKATPVKENDTTDKQKTGIINSAIYWLQQRFARSIKKQEKTDEVSSSDKITDTATPSPAHSANDTTTPFNPDNDDTTQDTSDFDIDDEFDRLNQANDDATNVATGTEPTFTIIDTSHNNGVINNDDADTEEDSSADIETHHSGIDETYDPKADLPNYKMPTTDLLTSWEKNNENISSAELLANKKRIEDTLKDYGILIVSITATPGPTVTLYEIKPTPGTRISRIKSLEDDIALSLSALGIRIIAPIPGRGTIGIEVPNAKPQVVSMKTMLESPAFVNNTKYELPIAIGKTISNEPFVTDLAKMPHLLMAGATGTGKSVGLNAVIASLLYKKHPSELKFVMVDPKKVELSLYNTIKRQYLAEMPDSEEPIITDTKKVVRTLNSLCLEMDQRYDLLKMAQVRKITEYNQKFTQRHLNPLDGHRYLPYIVLVIDEFADLIMTAGKEVEGPICRLAQLARAVGIHLIIATQRPTTNIITGTIKANFPARIAFKVTSAIDSRTILDTGGAQRLIGRGDMLISLAGSDLVRLQCALIETSEIEDLVKYIGSQSGYSQGYQLPEYLDENEEPNKDFDPKQKDEYFNDAARLVYNAGIASTSLLQRKMSLGFARAGRIIDQLEAAGIVGPANGSKPREVLIHDEATLEGLLRSL